MRTFRLAINMAGAVSAGAYTAGVLDFLTEALDAWSKAKANNEAVPSHDLSIDVIAGASAGGMCAAISAVLLQDDFDHISDVSKTGTNNRLYESWVNRIDIRPLLGTADMTKSAPIVSLLDSNIIDDIADYALVPGKPVATPRPYVSPDLTLFLSLTNLRGVPYSIDSVAPGSVEQTTFFYGDRIQFQTVRKDSAKPLATGAYGIDLSTGKGDSTQLRSAAKATGAFPIFLAPRTLSRRKSDYTPPLWESRSSAVKDDPPPISPSFPVNFADPFVTLNVDGGVTNNDPFNYAHDFLAALEPSMPNGQLETDPYLTDRAVLSVAPFPTTESYATAYDVGANSSVFSVLPRLFAALISQSRFFGESLSQLMRGTSFSNFVIAPSDDELAKQSTQGSTSGNQTPTALQCAALSAFGGFFERGFRAHDYQLGRRNCQKFLQDHFLLPADNIVIKGGLDTKTVEVRESIQVAYGKSAPCDAAEKLFANPKNSITPQTKWLPIIPLCTPELRTPIASVPRAQMKEADLDQIIWLLSKRFRALTSAIVASVPKLGLRWFLKPGPWFIDHLSRGPIKEALIKQLGDAYKAEK